MGKGRRQNLIPFNELSEEAKRAIRSKGGKAASEARRQQKKLRDAFAAALATKVQTPHGEWVTVAAALAGVTVKKALQGDMKALQRIESITCDKSQKVDVTSSDGSLERKPIVDLSKMTPEQIAELARAVYRGE